MPLTCSFDWVSSLTRKNPFWHFGCSCFSRFLFSLLLILLLNYSARLMFDTSYQVHLIRCKNVFLFSSSMDKKNRIDASRFILTIVYIEGERERGRDRSFSSPRCSYLYICLSVFAFYTYQKNKDINHRLAHVRRQMTHVRDIH